MSLKKKITIPLNAWCHLETMPLPADHSNWVPLLLCFSGDVVQRLHLCMINDDQPVPTTTVLKIYTGSGFSTVLVFYRAGFFPPIRKICSHFPRVRGEHIKTYLSCHHPVLKGYQIFLQPRKLTWNLKITWKWTRFFNHLNQSIIFRFQLFHLPNLP